MQGHKRLHHPVMKTAAGLVERSDERLRKDGETHPFVEADRGVGGVDVEMTALIALPPRPIGRAETVGFQVSRKSSVVTVTSVRSFPAS